MLELILEILNEIERKEFNLSIAGGRGYGTGKVYSKKSVSVLQKLGYEEGEDQPDEYEHKPVKISKAFKKRKTNDKRPRK